jgi:hypothetical protein
MRRMPLQRGSKWTICRSTAMVTSSDDLHRSGFRGCGESPYFSTDLHHFSGLYAFLRIYPYIGGGIVTARASNVTGSGGRPTTPIWRVKLPARLPFIPPKNLQSIELCTCRLWNGHDRTCSRTLPPTAGLAKGSAIVTVPQPARVGSSRSFGSGHTRAARGRNMDDQHSRRYLRWPRFVEIAGVERTL